MFDDRTEWLGPARARMREYAALRALIAEMEARAAALLAETVEAYAWPEDVPVPERPDRYGALHLGGRAYGEDLAGELAVAEGVSEGSALRLAEDVAALAARLPGCWAKITDGQAPLWHARRVLDECAGLTAAAWPRVDAAVAPCLGALGPARLFRAARAAATLADPGLARRRAEQASGRWVKTGPDRTDPLTGWLSGRLDRADALHLEHTIDRLAGLLAAEGSGDTAGGLRAHALGLLANPAAALAFIGGAGPDGDSDPAPAKAAAALAPRAQVYVHLWADSPDGGDALARLEAIGPLLVGQVAAITAGCRVRLTPAIHIGGAGIGVDSYEIPQHIRDQVLLRETHDVFPYSSVESRPLDLDHTVPWQPGGPTGQTAPGNLGPLSRRAHRIKTHAGWRLTQPRPGDFIWHTGAGQTVLVNLAGSRRLPLRQ